MSKVFSLYLKRLTISGFKSFAAKTELHFEPGITAIVGPNGSGKSNIADAVRWALGEQSVKQLRMKKGEELVFAGTTKRAKASMAEVSLLLDNSDGKLKLDFAEVELSRVIYRSGESDYRINGRKARLAEIQHLLAQAGFGQNSYTVIGQGTIDTFILSTPAERKLLFEEASGIRQYEIKREQAIKKLEATAHNLLRVKDITSELEPRLKHLAKAVENQQERQKLRVQLQSERAVYATTAERDYIQGQQAAERELAALAESVRELKVRIKGLEAQRQAMDTAKPATESGAAQALHQLEVERDELSNDVSVKKAEQQFLIEKLQEQESLVQAVVQLEAKLKHLKAIQVVLGKDLKLAQVAETAAAKELDTIAEAIRKNQARLAALRDQMRETNNGEFISHALSILRHIGQNPQLDMERVQDLVARAGRLLTSASFGDGDILHEVKKAQQELAQVMKQREQAHDAYTKAVIKVRALEMDLAKNLDDQAAVTVRVREITKQAEGRYKTQEQIDKRRALIETAESRLEAIAAEVTQARLEITQAQAGLSADEIFALATQLETARHELEQGEARQLALRQELAGIKASAKQLAIQTKQWFGGKTFSAKASDLSLEQLERGIAVLEGRLAEGGEGNTVLAEEYAEVSERYEFLTGQSQDLEKAKADMETVIAQLDKQIKAKFEAGFAAIARHFARNFERLFGGGSASLSLRTDESGSYGIDIKATPPGKRVESLGTLSGGERSLTGIALLAAILESNPSPFVVLDEIDAALDEANSDRIGAVLKDIAKRSQVLIITHNRAVMQAAHSIFGVTMDEHHVSRLLSIRFEEAKELAAAD